MKVHRFVHGNADSQGHAVLREFAQQETIRRTSIRDIRVSSQLLFMFLDQLAGKRSNRQQLFGESCDGCMFWGLQERIDNVAR